MGKIFLLFVSTPFHCSVLSVIISVHYFAIDLIIPFYFLQNSRSESKTIMATG